MSWLWSLEKRNKDISMNSSATKGYSRGTCKNRKQLPGNGSKSSGAAARTANDSKDKCNIFNRFFVSCAEDLRSTHRSSARSFFKWLPEIDRPEKFKLRKITVSEVRKALKELKSKKATGVDGIPSRLFKDGSDALASQLSVIFNLTIQQNFGPLNGKKQRWPLCTTQVQKMTQEITAPYPYYRWYLKS